MKHGDFQNTSNSYACFYTNLHSLSAEKYRNINVPNTKQFLRAGLEFRYLTMANSKCESWPYFSILLKHCSWTLIGVQNQLNATICHCLFTSDSGTVQTIQQVTTSCASSSANSEAVKFQSSIVARPNARNVWICLVLFFEKLVYNILTLNPILTTLTFSRCAA